MINLLPEKEKREWQVEEIGRKLSLAFLFILIFLLVLIFIVLALKIYILSQAKYSQDILENKEETLRSSQFLKFKQTLTETNQNLSKIKNFYHREIVLTSILEKLSILTPPTIYFTNLSFKKIFQEVEDEKTGKKEVEILAEIHLTGHAKTREDLFFFKKDLEREDKFEDVFFSPSSWVIPSDIDFSLSFKFIPTF